MHWMLDRQAFFFDRREWSSNWILVFERSKKGHYPLWGEVKFIDRDPHWYSRRVKEAIHIRLYLRSFNRDSGIEITEAWMPAIRQHNSRSLPQRNAEGSVSSCDNTNNALDRNPPTMSEVREAQITTTVVQIVQLSKSTLSMDTCSVRSKRHDQYQSDNRKTNDELNPLYK